MRISSKGRYALAAMICMAQTAAGENVTVLALSQRLDISKIYLEQVFSLLRRAGLVHSTKGAQGGYTLAHPDTAITAYDILAATETTLLEEPEDTVGTAAPGIEQAMQQHLFAPMNQALWDSLRRVTLSELALEAQRGAGNDGYMYYL